MTKDAIRKYLGNLKQPDAWDIGEDLFGKYSSGRERRADPEKQLSVIVDNCDDVCDIVQLHTTDRALLREQSALEIPWQGQDLAITRKEF